MAESTEKKIRKFLQVGTLECMIFGVVMAVLVWLLLIYQGFWKTLLFVAILLLFLFICGVKDKKRFVQGTVGRFAPQRNFPGSEIAGIKREDLEQKVRETVQQAGETATEAADEFEDAAEAVQEEAADLAEEATEAAEDAVADVQDAAEAVTEAVSETAEEAAETVQEAAAGAVEEAESKLKENAPAPDQAAE